MEPDGVFFSNGPGDPEPLEYAVENVKQLAGEGADLWNLPGASDLWAGVGREDLQAEVWASRRQSPRS